MTYTGDLGYEIWVAPEHQRALFDVLWHAGQPGGMALFGFRALMAMRMEKMFGTWYRGTDPIYTPLEAGMDRYLKLDHDFIGRARWRPRSPSARNAGWSTSKSTPTRTSPPMSSATNRSGTTVRWSDG